MAGLRSVVFGTVACLAAAIPALACGGSTGARAQSSPFPTGAAAHDAQLLLGRTVFSSHCAQCHGSSGQGGVGPSFNGGVLLRTFPTAARQVAFVKAGKGVMPAWRGVLSEAQLEAVVRYEREVLSGSPP